MKINKENLKGKTVQSKEVKIPVDLVTAIVFIVFASICLFLMPSQIEISKNEVVNGRDFPRLLMYIIILCSVLLGGKEIRKIIQKEPLEYKVINLGVELKALTILSIILIFFVVGAITELFVVGACLSTIGFLKFFNCKKCSYYIITLTATIVIWIVFRFVLNVKF